MSPQEQACAIARQFLEGKRSLIETCRNIQAPLEELGLRSDGMCRTFAGIDSEADEYPLGRDREHWNREALAKKDSDFVKFEEFYRPHVEVACRRVLERFESPTQ